MCETDSHHTDMLQQWSSHPQKYSRIPLIRINWDSQATRQLDFSFKIGYNGSLKKKKISTSSYFRLRISLYTNKTADHLTSTQPLTRLNGSSQRPHESRAKQTRWGGGAGIWVMTVNFHRWWGIWEFLV